MPPPANPTSERSSTGPVVLIAAGRWQAELRGDELADIAFDGVPLLRAIRPVVRDQDWNTVPVRVVGAPGAGVVDLVWTAPGIDYAGRLQLDWAADELRVSFSGRAGTAFARNRIGLVVLHRADEAGRRVEAVHTDGSVEAARWPTTISPHQPFVDVAGFRWETNGIAAELSLTGEIFETEDQRNWTDLSFKTYSTPLSEPFPVTLEVGDRVEQAARLRATGGRTTAPRGPDNRVVIFDEVVGSVPALGLGAYVFPGADDRPGPGSPSATVLLELLEPVADWDRQIAQAQLDAAATGAALDVRLVTRDPDVIGLALDRLPLDRLQRLGVFDRVSHTTTAELWRGLVDQARVRGLEPELLAGTRAHFTELNRQFDLLPGDAPALTFSLTPQMHAYEIPHLVDSLTAQRLVAQNAVRLAEWRPVHVGPVTLARRFNAVATSDPPSPAEAAAAAVDPLQPTGFAAAWTLGSVAALSVPGVTSVTYFETRGPRGVRAEDGTAYPVAEVLRWVHTRRGAPVRHTTAPPGIAVYAVGEGRPIVALANLTPTPRDIVLERDGTESHVHLEPWEVALLEG